jgi:DNA ligase (NAD+)
MNKIGRTTEIIKLENVKFKPNILNGYNIVITGALEHFSRKNIETIVTDLGGFFQKAVSSNTSFLVIGGEHIGSKYQKAKELNIKIIDEKDFLMMILEDEVNLEIL